MDGPARERSAPQRGGAHHRRLGIVGVELVGGGNRRGGRGRLGRQPAHQRAKLLGAGDVVQVHVLHRTPGHARVGCVVGILHHGEAACGFDRVEPRGSVVQRTRKDHADDPGAIGAGRAPKQWVEGWPVAVLARSSRQQDTAGLEQQVAVGPAHVDVPGADRLMVDGGGYGEGAGPPQDARKGTNAMGREMVHDEHRGGQIGGKTRDQLKQGIDTPGRESDHYDIVPMHPARTPLPASIFSSKAT